MSKRTFIIGIVMTFGVAAGTTFSAGTANAKTDDTNATEAGAGEQCSNGTTDRGQSEDAGQPGLDNGQGNRGANRQNEDRCASTGSPDGTSTEPPAGNQQGDLSGNQQQGNQQGDLSGNQQQGNQQGDLSGNQQGDPQVTANGGGDDLGENAGVDIADPLVVERQLPVSPAPVPFVEVPAPAGTPSDVAPAIGAPTTVSLPTSPAPAALAAPAAPSVTPGGGTSGAYQVLGVQYTRLARTGVPTSHLALAALALVGAGLLMVFASRSARTVETTS